ncbi:unnamed protein product [Camellia sinensis]
MAATRRVVNLSSNPRHGSYSLKETMTSFLKCLGFGSAAKPEDPSAVPSSTPDPFAAAPLSTTTEDPAAAPPSTLVEDVALGQARPPPKGGSGPHNNTDHT